MGLRRVPPFIYRAQGIVALMPRIMYLANKAVGDFTGDSSIYSLPWAALLLSGDALIGRNLLSRHPVPTPRRGIDYPVVGLQLHISSVAR